MKPDFSEALILFQNKKMNEAKNICEEILKQEKNNSQVYNCYFCKHHEIKKLRTDRLV